MQELHGSLRNFQRHVQKEQQSTLSGEEIAPEIQQAVQIILDQVADVTVDWFPEGQSGPFSTFICVLHHPINRVWNKIFFIIQISKYSTRGISIKFWLNKTQLCDKLFIHTTKNITVVSLMFNSICLNQNFSISQKNYTSITSEQIHWKNFPLMNSQIFHLYCAFKVAWDTCQY